MLKKSLLAHALPMLPLLLALLAPRLTCAQQHPTSAASPAATAPSPDDPYRWLEEVEGEKALAWVRQQNDITTRELTSRPDFEPLRQRLLSILNSKERIPLVALHGDYYYNFWRDEQHVRGLLRRTTLEEYKKPSPAWETVLDLDALAASEKANWVWKRAEFLEPRAERCLVLLSRGGADAVVVREFDLLAKRFIPNGFSLPEAKTDVAWRDRDSLYVATDFGPGSMTSSGYARIVKQWQRDTPLDQARAVMEGQPDDVAWGPYVVRHGGKVYELITREITFFTNDTFLRRGDAWVRLEKPADAQVHLFDDWLLLRLRSSQPLGGQTYAAGTLLAINLEAFLQGSRTFTTLFEPSPRRALTDITITRHHLLLTELDNVRSRVSCLQPEGQRWSRTAVEVPAFGSVYLNEINEETSDDFFLTLTDFLTPSSLALATAGKPGHELLKTLPAFFNAEGLDIQQFEATSRDGTRIPYFQVSRKGMRLDGSAPTLLYGYGGYEISMLPSYRASMGAAWLEKGGVYVLANIRGGGEFGPDWHNAARKEHRQRAYDDFAAVAEDLIARNVTSPRHLGIMGGSNGGLLVGVMLTQRPDLFGAVVCQVPLLDMRRYHKLLAGASWIDEYGNPDLPHDWSFLSRYSPYQNVLPDRHYPRTLFITSTRDDRVHPGHARKMTALMEAQGHDVLYYENTEGGHGAAANNQQAAFMDALQYTFLWKQLP